MRFFILCGLLLVFQSCTFNFKKTQDQTTNQKTNFQKRQRPIYNNIILSRIKEDQSKNFKTQDQAQAQKEDDYIYLESRIQKIKDGQIKLLNSPDVNQGSNRVDDKQNASNIANQTNKNSEKKDESYDENKIQQESIQEIKTQKEQNNNETNPDKIDKTKDEVKTNNLESLPENLIVEKQDTVKQFANQNNSLLNTKNNEPVIEQKKEIDKNQDRTYDIKPRNVFDKKYTEDQQNQYQTKVSPLPKILKSTQQDKDSYDNRNKTFLEPVSKQNSIKYQNEVKNKQTYQSLNEDDDIIIDEKTKLDLEKYSQKNYKPLKLSDMKSIDEEQVFESKVPISQIIANRVNKSSSKSKIKTIDEDKIQTLMSKTKFEVWTESEIKDTYSVQVGSYEIQEEAIQKANEISKLINVFIQPVVINDKDYYRVKTGPFDEKKQAEKTLYMLIKNKYYDVFVVKN
jgi:hypothetical protein